MNKEITAKRKTQTRTKTRIVHVLDYVVKNTGNGDGWVLLKPDTAYENLWQCHLGNFKEWEDAVPYAINYFMLTRPAIFANRIAARLAGQDGLYMDYYIFINTVDSEGLRIPDAITCSKDGGYTLVYNGEKI